MATNNAINLKAQGLAYYDGAGLFSAPSISQFQLVVGAAANNVASISNGSAGQALVSAGGSSNPAFGVLGVVGGGTGLASMTAYALLAGGTTSTGALQQVSGLGSVGQVLTSAGAGALPVWSALPANNFPWTVVTAATQAVSANAGYFANAASGGVDFTLPASAPVGAEFKIAGLNSGSGWIVDYNAGQQIQMGSSLSTLDTGSLASTDPSDCITLFCAVADTLFVVTDSMGNISIV